MSGNFPGNFREKSGKSPPKNHKKKPTPTKSKKKHRVPGICEEFTRKMPGFYQEITRNFVRNCRFGPHFLDVRSCLYKPGKCPGISREISGKIPGKVNQKTIKKTHPPTESKKKHREMSGDLPCNPSEISRKST